MDPRDQPPDPKRQSGAIASSVVMFLQAISVLCGEDFLTHEEHIQLVKIADQAGHRWLDAKETLDKLDFEP